MPFGRFNLKRATAFLLSGMTLSVGLMLTAPPQATAAEIRNINFSVFQKLSDDFEFEPIVLGKFSDFIEAMEGSQILLLSHTKDSIDGDVINLQQDVLRESSEGLNDIGISCTLTFSDSSSEEETSFEIGGLCRIIDSLNENIIAIIPMTSLPDTDQGIDAWVELYEDEESGVAFFANVGTSD